MQPGRAAGATLSELLDGGKPTRAQLRVFEGLGVLARVSGERYFCADRTRLRLALLALRIGLSRDELAQLLGLYDARTTSTRDVSHFVGLLALYQRFIAAPPRRSCRISSA